MSGQPKVIIVTQAFHQKIENKRAVLTGVGLAVSGVEEPFIATRTDMTYGILWLNLVKNLLKKFVIDLDPKEKTEIRFITGFADLAKMGVKVQRTITKCVEAKARTEEEVDTIHYRLCNWERRANHQLYVDIVCLALQLIYDGIDVSFHSHTIKTPQCGELYSKVQKKVDPSFTPKAKNPPL
jgi:hypothetical protein